MDEGLFRCCLLLGMLAGAVPVNRVGDRGERDVQQHRQPGTVLVPCGVLPDRLDAAAQDACAVQVGGDAGAGGALEDGRGLFEFGLQRRRCGDRQ
ncbi:hypothetical protein [Streptomyces sp. NPDC101237]|uniref:hypothetical protein n=1 Tax=Streptomyces sp. NPDC101237 TaxID=3366139 RepID=UPI00380F69E5